MTCSFIALPEVMLEFFKRVKGLEVDTEEERIKVLLSMIEEGYKISVSKTDRTPEQVVKDYAKHGEVLWVKGKEDAKEEDVENKPDYTWGDEDTDDEGIREIDLAYEEGFADGYAQAKADARVSDVSYDPSLSDLDSENLALRSRVEVLEGRINSVASLIVTLEEAADKAYKILRLTREYNGG